MVPSNEFVIVSSGGYRLCLLSIFPFNLLDFSMNVLVIVLIFSLRLLIPFDYYDSIRFNSTQYSIQFNSIHFDLIRFVSFCCNTIWKIFCFLYFTTNFPICQCVLCGLIGLLVYWFFLNPNNCSCFYLSFSLLFLFLSLFFLLFFFVLFLVIVIFFLLFAVYIMFYPNAKCFILLLKVLLPVFWKKETHLIS